MSCTGHQREARPRASGLLGQEPGSPALSLPTAQAQQAGSAPNTFSTRVPLSRQGPLLSHCPAPSCTSNSTVRMKTSTVTGTRKRHPGTGDPALPEDHRAACFTGPHAPAAWLLRPACTGPTWLVGGTRATPLLVTKDGAVEFRHRLSDFSLREPRARGRAALPV